MHLYASYQANDVKSSSDVQINQLNQELNTLKEHSAALEEELQSRILVLECSAQASLDELMSMKAKALSEREAESTCLDDLERECDELKQQLAESQSALHGMQASAADEKEALTVERDDLLSQFASLNVRTTGLSEALAAAQAIINEVRISAGPGSHSEEVVGEATEEEVGEVQAESSESVLHHNAGAVVATESELSGEVQQSSGEWKVHLCLCLCMNM
jgi:DNA repair exonuclease SbcCD ATPase subunit